LRELSSPAPFPVSLQKFQSIVQAWPALVALFSNREVVPQQFLQTANKPSGGNGSGKRKRAQVERAKSGNPMKIYPLAPLFAIQIILVGAILGVFWKEAKKLALLRR
jgi:hypothetical protein